MDTEIFSANEDVSQEVIQFSNVEYHDGTYDPVAAFLPGRRLSCEQMLAQIEQCRADLDGRGVNLFRNALTRPPRSGLLENYLRPNLLVKGSHYIHVTPVKNINWRGGATEYLVTNGYVPELCGIFGNPLMWKGRTTDDTLNRSYNAGFTVMTVEFDAALPLPEQLAIIYTGVLARIDAALRQYRDYRGYEVVYSAGKSLHFHFIFDLRHLKRELAFAGNSSYQDNWRVDLPDGARLRAAYEDRWTKLVEIFYEVSGLTVAADRSLRHWEQLRRFPWALRAIDKPAHPLGFAIGDVIHQPVLAGKLIMSIPRGASQWFFDASQLNQSYDTGKKVEHQFYRRPINCPSDAGDWSLTVEQKALVMAEAPATFEAAIGQEYPRFSHFVTNANGFKCYFYNHPGDGKPASFCEGDRDRIVIVGTGHGLGDGVVMFRTPNAIIGRILAKQKRNEVTAPVNGGDGRPLIEIALLHTFLMVVGPEGCGKSTEMMLHVEEMVHDADGAGAIFFSSPSIRQAAKKAEEFRRLHPDSQYVPYLYLSVTALYEKHCPGPDRISRIDVLNEGLTSWLQEVWQEQPHIYAKMWEDRNRLFEIYNEGRIPILFGCHETVRQHAAGSSLTRIFYARSFDERYWELPGPKRRALRSRCWMENLIFRVIFDEVSDADLVSRHTADLVVWVRNCCVEIGWGDEDQKLPDLFRRFNGYLTAHPIAGMTWDMFLEIATRDYCEADRVTISEVEVLFDDKRSIYHAEVGSAYYAKTHWWWNEYPRVTMLTTELVPATIIRAIDRQAAEAGETQDDRFVVHVMPTPASPDTVAVHVDRRCHKRGLPGLSMGYRQHYPGIEIISDMLDKHVPEKVTTHLSARGSNDFISKDVAAFYTAISAKQFAEIAVLNSKFDTNNMVRLFYVDRFNQTCGRNRGYRSGGDSRPKHIAVMSDRLLRWIKPVLDDYARYVLCREQPLSR